MLGIISGPGFFRLSLALVVLIDHLAKLNLGNAAVYIFFTLSGYWICVMWNARYSKLRNAYAVYVTSRLWRLLPSFILCSAIAWTLLISSGKVPAHLDMWHQLISNLFILGYKGLSFSPILPAWSLDVEVQFYLIAPLLLLALRSSGAPGFLFGCALISIGGILLHEQMTVAVYLVFFALGMSAAHVRFSVQPRLAYASLAGTVAAIFACLASPLNGILLGGAHPGPLYLAFNPAAEVVLALCMAPWAIFTTSRPDTPTDGMFGDLSYIVYLLHWPLFKVMNTSSGGIIHRLSMMTLLVMTTLLGSWLIWIAFDRPINRMRARWVSRRAPALRLSLAGEPNQ